MTGFRLIALMRPLSQAARRLRPGGTRSAATCANYLYESAALWRVESFRLSHLQHFRQEKSLRETEIHRCMSKQEYQKMIVHEFVYVCQSQCFHRLIDKDKFCLWFWEALATNLSKQEYPYIGVECTAEQLLLEFPYIPNSYTHAYNIGKYIISS